ncbi:hypothetical protein CORC01_04634 [Colletotrichum orchidophilum]|uniref:Uncharacterized protein n=1 Tax=Colletotrichum orchidophilum TaxID=1209926 RepID=A0A1G4BF67_9PEZI|nr:uncharacterized protein CORC01_04634 [Colletotrichum orchidophilum]OHE99987.1 hypothetical protein CORC01_04634 [Colletotrichum orchidophilum]
MPSQRYRLADPVHDPTTIAPLGLSTGGYRESDGGLPRTGLSKAAPRRLRKPSKPCRHMIAEESLHCCTRYDGIRSTDMRRHSRETNRGFSYTSDGRQLPLAYHLRR